MYRTGLRLYDPSVTDRFTSVSSVVRYRRHAGVSEETCERRDMVGRVCQERPWRAGNPTMIIAKLCVTTARCIFGIDIS